MIPILYDKTETVFSSMGLGAIPDALSCKVTEHRNGKYELEMTYPSNGVRFDDIQLSRIIFAQPSYKTNSQPFRIYEITKPMNGKVKISAEHISYQLNNIPVLPFTENNVVNGFEKLKERSAETNPFTFENHLGSAKTGKVGTSVPISARSFLGGSSNSFLSAYGGEFEFDVYKVKLHAQRGLDRGVTIRYGKNLVSLEQEESIESTITGICPFYYSEDTLVTLSEKVLHSSNSANFPFQRTIAKDFTDRFETIPTEAELRTVAQAYINASGVGVPEVNLDVEFIHLAEFAEYKDIAILEQVNLCDTVSVVFEKLGVNAKAKVVKTVYDVLNEKYTKISIGSVRANLANTIAENKAEVEEIVNKIPSAVEEATSLITGNRGGYVVIKKDSDGKPQEILIMDTDSIGTAQKVWRWNNSGLGYSSTGYNGTYSLAMTQEGKIVADFIKAGVLEGVEVRADVGRIGEWGISSDGMQKIGDGAIEGVKYKAFFNPPTASDPIDSTVLSIEISKDGGEKYVPVVKMRSDGTLYLGDGTYTATYDSWKSCNLKHDGIRFNENANGNYGVLDFQKMQLYNKQNKTVTLANGRYLSAYGYDSGFKEQGYLRPDKVNFLTGDTFEELAVFPAEMMKSGSWFYKKLGKTIYELYTRVKITNQSFTSAYGNLYFASKSMPLPSDIAPVAKVSEGKLNILEVSGGVVAETGLYGISFIGIGTITSNNSANLKYYIYSAKQESGITMYATVRMLLEVQE